MMVLICAGSLLRLRLIFVVTLRLQARIRYGRRDICSQLSRLVFTHVVGCSRLIAKGIGSSLIFPPDRKNRQRRRLSWYRLWGYQSGILVMVLLVTWWRLKERRL